MLKRGDKVLISGVPYSFDTRKGRCMADESGGRVAVQWGLFGAMHKAVYTTQVTKIGQGRIMKLSRPAIITGIVIGVIAIFGLWFAGNYNSLVTADNSVANSKAKIDTQLERRYELIDNIVASVKGSQAQESDVFGKIAAARKIGGDSNDASTQAQANQTIDTQIALLPRLQEAYPELKSNDQVSKLIAELQGTAGQVASARDTYNDTVTNYNNNISRFPKSIFANSFGFDKKELFKASTAAQTNPTVNFDKKN